MRNQKNFNLNDCSLILNGRRILDYSTSQAISLNLGEEVRTVIQGPSSTLTNNKSTVLPTLSVTLMPYGEDYNYIYRLHKNNTSVDGSYTVVFKDNTGSTIKYNYILTGGSITNIPNQDFKADTGMDEGLTITIAFSEIIDDV